MELKTEIVLQRSLVSKVIKHTYTHTKASGEKTQTQKRTLLTKGSVRFVLKSPEIESLSTTLKAPPDVQIQLDFNQISKFVLLVYDLN